MKQSFGNTGLLLAQLDLIKECRCVFHRHCADFANVLARNSHLPCFHPQPVSIALRTPRVSTIAAQKDPHVQLVFFPLQVLEEATHARELRFPIKDSPLLLGFEIGPCDIQRNVGLPRETLHLRGKRSIFGFGPRLDCAFVQTFAWIWNH